MRKYKSSDDEKIIRKVTFHLYKNQTHDQTQISSVYKSNRVTGELGKDPYKLCKNLKEVKEVLLTDEREVVSKIFKEGFDFILFKINKGGLSVFQQIFPNELNNSVRFIKEVDLSSIIQ
jgi:hypothetical protein